MVNPVLVNDWRGEVVENRHRGAVAVCDPRGRLLRSWGDVDALVYPRSAIKLLQALPLVESGAADHYGLGNRELALACASHSAEPVHTEAVRRWLQRIDLDESALECGAHPPYHEATAATLLAQRQEFGRVHNNCSGKHTAMLTTCRFRGDATRGYIERDHPAQQRWFDALGEMSGVDMRALPWNRDGCGIPVVAMPLTAIATAFARVAAPDDLAAQRAAAIDRLATAIAEQPLMIAGSGRVCSEVIEHSGRRTLVKSGAAGVFTAALQEQGLGVALKMDAGNGDAAAVAMLEILRQLGGLHAEELARLGAFCRVPNRNTRGVITGYLQAADI